VSLKFLLGNYKIKFVMQMYVHIQSERRENYLSYMYIYCDHFVCQSDYNLLRYILSLFN